MPSAFQDGARLCRDRSGNRIQVFTKEGKFQKEFYIARNTKIRAPQGRWTSRPIRSRNTSLSADIANSTVWELDRQTGQVVQRIGRPGAKAAPSACCMSRLWIPRQSLHGRSRRNQPRPEVLAHEVIEFLVQVFALPAEGEHLFHLPYQTRVKRKSPGDRQRQRVGLTDIVTKAA